MTEHEGNILAEKLDEVGELLRPYFDSVLILTMYRTDNATMFQAKEIGNSFANKQVAEDYASGEVEKWLTPPEE